jgi:hypothetical protein
LLKAFGALAELETAISQGVDDLLKRMYDSTPDLRGREEEFTGGIRYEVNGHLLSTIQGRLNGHRCGGLAFRVETFTKTLEAQVGADLAGVVSISIGGSTVTKAFLAQAKVAQATPQGWKSSNPDSLRQAADMLRLSSDSFFFLYAPAQVFVVPAFSVLLGGKAQIDSTEHYFMPLARFYAEFFKCFIGDHLLAGGTTDPRAIADWARQLPARRAILRSAAASPGDATEGPA